MDVNASPKPKLGEPFVGYLLEEFLGKGGMSEVFRARHLASGQVVALKLISLNTENVEAVRARFVREVNLQARFVHPHVVNLLEYGQEEELLWMSMELIEGETLLQILQREGRLHAKRAAGLMIQVCRALEESHKHEIIHRDLKPSNIMVSSHHGMEMVKVFDFGVGKAIGEEEDPDIQDLTGTLGGVMATPRYAAPELLLEEGVGPGTDIYSAGLIFFELVTGRPAFESEDMVELLTYQLSMPVEIPPEVEGTLIEEVVKRATKKPPAERYSSAKDLRQAFTQFLNRQEAASVHKLSRVGVVSLTDMPAVVVVEEELEWDAWMKRSRRKNLLLFVVVLIALGVLGYLLLV